MMDNFNVGWLYFMELGLMFAPLIAFYIVIQEERHKQGKGLSEKDYLKYLYKKYYHKNDRVNRL